MAAVRRRVVCDLMASFVSVSMCFARTAFWEVVAKCVEAVPKKLFIVSEIVCVYCKRNVCLPGCL